jgi:hypothetical protein
LPSQGLENELARLNTGLNNAIRELTAKKEDNAAQSSELYRLEKELRFQISVLGRAVVAERTKSNINWDEIKTKKGEQYKIWMEDELKAIQDTYEEQMGDVQQTLEKMYKTKVSIFEGTSVNPLLPRRRTFR